MTLPEVFNELVLAPNSLDAVSVNWGKSASSFPGKVLVLLGN